MEEKDTLKDVWMWIYEYILSWRWFVRFVRYLMLSGGVVAESAFMVGTLYVTACVVVHVLLSKLFMDDTIVTLNQIVMLVFAWVPELVVLHAIKESASHWKTAHLTRDKYDYGWAVAYSLPTLVFLFMTVTTLLSFVSINSLHSNDPNSYQVSGVMLNLRVLSGWFYGLVGMLYDSVGVPTLNQQLVESKREVEILNQQLVESKREVEASKTAQKKLEEDLKFSIRQGHRPLEVLVQLAQKGTKTVSFDELKAMTGYSKRKLESAKLRRSSRNSELILVESVINWLKSGKDQSEPVLKLVNEE